MNTLKAYIVIVSVIFFSGCITAPQVPVPLAETYWGQTEKKLGVFIQPLEKPALHMEGAVGLLDYAINTGAMSSVTTHFESLDISDYGQMHKEVLSIFSAKGVQLINLPNDTKLDDLPEFEDPNEKDTVYFSRKNFTAFKKKHGVDHLLAITPVRIGIARPYHGFIPTGDPRAVFELKVEMVDLATNQLLWYSDISRSNNSSGNWDEPPTYPGLSNAFYASLESAKQSIISELKRASAANQKASLK